jgi:hypothetical protein
VTTGSRGGRIRSKMIGTFRRNCEELIQFLDDACESTQRAVQDALAVHEEILAEQTEQIEQTEGAGEPDQTEQPDQTGEPGSEAPVGVDALALPHGGYASACAERTISPVGGELARLDVGASLRDRWETFCADMGEAADRVPGDVAAHHGRVGLPSVFAPFVEERVAMLGHWVHHLERGARRWWESVREGAAAPTADSLADWVVVAEAEWTPLVELMRVELSEALATCERDLAADPAPGGVGAPTAKALRSVSWSSFDPSGRWVEWHREAVARLTLECALVGLRADLYRLCASHVEGLETSLAGLSAAVREAAEGLEGLGSECVVRLEAARETGLELDTVASEEGAFMDAFNGGVLDDIATFGTGPESPRARGDELADRVLRLVGRQPASVVVHRLAEGDRPDLGSGGIPFEFRRSAAQCIDAFLVERLRTTSHSVLAEPLFDARAAIETIPGIIESSFNMLEVEVEAGREVDAEVIAMVPEMVAHLRTVATEAADVLDRAAEPLGPEIAESLEGSWQKLVERTALTSEVRAQLAGARSALNFVTRATFQDAWIGLERSYQDTRKIWSRRWTRLRGWFRSLQDTEGDPEAHTRSETLSLLMRAPDRIERLPLVYRHLFSAAPVREPGLFVGREDLMARIQGAARSSGRHRPLLLVSDPGVGASSIFGALEASKLGSRVRRVTLRERLLNESELITAFQGAGIDAHGYGLDALPTVVSSGANSKEGAPLVLLEGLEHAFFRRPDGSSLVVSLLTAIAGSGDPVDWVVGISGSAWQVISRSSPHAAAGWDVRTVAPFGRKDLEAAIWTRHQRSGIPLSFVPPRDASRRLLRRLRLAIDDDARQEILRELYFDRLHQESDGFLALALILWLDGLKLREGSGAAMKFPVAMDSTFLKGLDLEQAFALKSILEHGSLTQNELAEVLRLTDPDAARVLTGLEQLQLLTPIPDGPGGAGELSLGVPRLQIRRPVVSLVIRFLKDRNILH